MKRILWPVIFLALLSGGLWIYFSQKKNPKIREELVFHISDTAQIQQIRILDREGKQTVLERREGQWWLNGDQPARQHAVNNLLSTLHDQKVAAMIPTAAREQVVKDLGSNSVRIDVRGKKTSSDLTFYVGGVPPDERGTFMIREGSECPVIVGIPGFEGSLRSRYIMPDLDWVSRKLMPDISGFKEIRVDYPGQQEHGMILKKEEGECVVEPGQRGMDDRVSLNQYICEAYRDILQDLQAEAVLEPGRIPDFDPFIPFCMIMVVDGDHQEHELLFYPTERIDGALGMDKPAMIERYYTIYNGERLFLTQQALMQKAFIGYEHLVQAGKK